MRVAILSKDRKALVASLLVASMLPGCASLSGNSGTSSQRAPRATARDKTLKGAGIGAATGAVGAIVLGKRKANQILAGAAIGGVVGAGVGAYMDAQEEKLARIPGTTVERLDKDTLLVRFDSDVLFPFDSARLTSDARPTVNDVADVVAQYKKTAVVVQGHTDSTGSAEYNKELSERRADTVLDALADRGVAESRMASEGYGEEFPVASNSSDRGRSLNRRVTVMLRAKAT
jgi:outer membrane protein OmpA-like peptidoglycan-associated protein